jgi:hypothetical protein
MLHFIKKEQLDCESGRNKSSRKGHIFDEIKFDRDLGKNQTMATRVD